MHVLVRIMSAQEGQGHEVFGQIVNPQLLTWSPVSTATPLGWVRGEEGQGHEVHQHNDEAVLGKEKRG